jgi:uncharacterized membrane protein YhiD involved in acid resistance
MEPLSVGVIIFRITLAFVLSTIFGLERQFKKKPVGFSTFTFVSVGSCIMTLTALILTEGVNPLGLLGGIVTGVGFLGAGAIVKEERKMYGFTTAAAIWAFAALGIGIGSGLIYQSLIFYGFVLIIVFIDSCFEKHSFGPYYKRLSITLEDINILKEVTQILPKTNKVEYFNFNVKNNEYTFSFSLNTTEEELNKIPVQLMKLKKVKQFRID